MNGQSAAVVIKHFLDPTSNIFQLLTIVFFNRMNHYCELLEVGLAEWSRSPPFPFSTNCSWTIVGNPLEHAWLWLQLGLRGFLTLEWVQLQWASPLGTPQSQSSPSFCRWKTNTGRVAQLTRPTHQLFGVAGWLLAGQLVNFFITKMITNIFDAGLLSLTLVICIAWGEISKHPFLETFGCFWLTRDCKTGQNAGEGFDGQRAA